ncbi:mannose-1-phosphate guanylyltransferase/mannose-6-phosphate isomerase [Halovulum dunhuangense]|uniref:mannose-1-phosphate guanylyltransferase n=1 Tax=Halovulum dunhuangense TaxID=1505036 RepID=A0A849L7J8_9RHOB|nr:mannose-1-phosphate guanylyltransferase/mannose-6-phosphate isomerase [Halovulum dunhuangense]NNU82070.1 mannose-1-phosphate guanylyltransferase/mannose-6-phosphate isomerase [Halovulum dunhuangense]
MAEQDAIHPVILCGGSGTRLWPLSRKSYPKQFARLTGPDTLFQQTAKRLSGPGLAAPTVLTHSDFRFIVTEQLAAAGVDPGAILIEPDGRNTAPAILAAALHLERTAPDALMLVAPSDHVLRDADAFRAALEAGAEAARAGRIVTFGVVPDRPETGYGYLRLGARGAIAPGVQPLAGFVEKPDRATAEAMLAEGGYLWNAGIFLFSVRNILAAFAAHAPDLIDPVRHAVDGARPDLGFLRLDPEGWAGARDISIDFAVMERADNLSVVPLSGGWSDLGDWQAIWREGAQDAAGVVTSGDVTAMDCRDSLLRAESGAQTLVGIGVENLIAIAMPDAVLVADISRAQEAKEAVAALKARGARQATQLPVDHRPWGWFESLALGPRFQVKRIFVHPGAALSLQSHMHRSEHWIVVRGTAKVTIGATTRLVAEGESVHIPLGEKHRLENPGKLDLELIEVQTGAYLGEDDITRYEDVYARG